MGKDDKLVGISKINLIGRLIEWIKDLISFGKRSEHVDQVMKSTLKAARDNLKADPVNNFYFNRLNDPYHWEYISLSDFANKIKDFPICQRLRIEDVVAEIDQLALNAIKNLTQEQRKHYASLGLPVSIDSPLYQKAATQAQENYKSNFKLQEGKYIGVRVL